MLTYKCPTCEALHAISNNDAVLMLQGERFLSCHDCGAVSRLTVETIEPGNLSCDNQKADLAPDQKDKPWYGKRGEIPVQTFEQVDIQVDECPCCEVDETQTPEGTWRDRPPLL